VLPSLDGATGGSLVRYGRFSETKFLETVCPVDLKFWRFEAWMIASSTRSHGKQAPATGADSSRCSLASAGPRRSAPRCWVIPTPPAEGLAGRPSPHPPRLPLRPRVPRTVQTTAVSREPVAQRDKIALQQDAALGTKAPVGISQLGCENACGRGPEHPGRDFVLGPGSMTCWE
jgi:hypothetical protein